MDAITLASMRLAAKRRAKLRRLRARGMTYAQIGARYGITRQRVQQILARP